MGGFIKVDANRAETTALNTQVNKELFDRFKIKCKELGYPLNITIELFMQQYSSGRFDIASEDILKWKRMDEETDTLNTTFNKEIYTKFKRQCKSNGFFIKHVVMAFMECFLEQDLVLEYIDRTTAKQPVTMNTRKW